MIGVLSFQALQQRFGGHLPLGNLDFSLLETDSRVPLEGKVFLALKGEHFDGHRFCQQALDQGAVGLVVSDYQPGIALPQWCVSDTRIALGQIAAFNRERFTGPVIGITGNSGKTTVKEMLGTILSEIYGAEAVLITAGNFNNDIGVPLTLLRLSAAHQFAVIELGANHVGEIAYCAQLAQPDVGVVLNVTGAHLGEFGSLERIATAKGELIEALASDGHAVINQDDYFAGYWESLVGERLLTRYGLQDMTGSDLWAANLQAGPGGYHFDLCTSDEQQSVQLQVPAKHNVANALAAAAAAQSLAVPLVDIASGLSRFAGVNGRLQIVTGHKQSRIINDSYNANPGSVRAAIDTLMDFSGNRILVLGDIAELGDGAESAHRDLGDYAREQGVNMLLTTGPYSALASERFGKDARHFADKQALAEALQALLTPETTVLIKGSRSAGMETVVNRISEQV